MNIHAYKVVALELLKPYDRNPRTHSDDQIEQLRASIKEFGFTNPLLVDESYGIIAGHGRYLAGKLEGMAEFPVIVVSGLSASQRRALVLLDDSFNVDVIGFTGKTAHRHAESEAPAHA